MTTMFSDHEASSAMSRRPPVTPEQRLALRTLIEQSGLSHASAALTAFDTTAELSWFENDLKSMHRIYLVRSQIVAKKGSSHSGWSELIAGLERELAADPETRVRLYYHVSDTPLLLFTDAASSKLLGFLVNSSEHPEEIELNSLHSELEKTGR